MKVSVTLNLKGDSQLREFITKFECLLLSDTQEIRLETFLYGVGEEYLRLYHGIDITFEPVYLVEVISSYRKRYTPTLVIEVPENLELNGYFERIRILSGLDITVD